MYDTSRNGLRVSGLQHLVLAWVGLWATTLSATTYPVYSVKSVAADAEWIALTRVIESKIVNDCAAAGYDKVVQLRLEVRDFWKGSAPRQVVIRVRFSNWLNLPVNQLVVVAAMQLRTLCPNLLSAEGVLPVDGDNVSTLSLADEPAVQPLKQLRTKFEKAMRAP